MTANVESMMYSGATPWHGLGVKVDGLQTSSDAIAKAGLDWKVEKRPVHYADKSGQLVKMPERFVVVRQTDDKAYATVGPDYTPLQNRQAFAFFDAIVGEKAAIYETAGSLLEGRRVWILAKLTKDSVIAKTDLVQNYLLLANGHDGGMAVHMYFTPVRVVCHNTLAMSLRGKVTEFCIRHSQSVVGRVEEARRALGITVKWVAEFEEAANAMAQRGVTVTDATQFIDKLLPMPGGEASDKVKRSVQDDRDQIQRLFSGEGKGLNDVSTRHSVWNLYQAAVEFSDWLKPQFMHKVPASRADVKKLMAKVERHVWGSVANGGAEFKRKAWDQAVELMHK